MIVVSGYVQQTDPQEIRQSASPSSLALLDYWESKRAARPMPRREELDPIEMKQWLGLITLIDVNPDPPCFRYRLVGTGHVELHGNDPTGKSVIESQYSEDRSKFLSILYSTLNNKSPVLTLQTISYKRIYRAKMESLTLPIGDGSGSVTMILLYSHLDNNNIIMRYAS